MRTARSRLVPVAVIAIIAAGCATVPPKELVLARQAYDRASHGPASERAPAEVHKAKASLDKAEAAFADAPKAQKTRDLAYVAERKAQLASAIAEMRRSERAQQRAEGDYLAKHKQIGQQARAELDDTRDALAATERERRAGANALGVARTARYDADQRAYDADQRAAEYEQRAKDAADALAKLAAVKEEQRGLVITLSGSILFATNQATLLPAAQARLNQVSRALLATKERSLVVEGHTDSQGSTDHNLRLSQRRAEAVRVYLISRGYPARRIQAHGIGEARPITDNRTVEGRANNRRVEIVVQPKLASR